MSMFHVGQMVVCVNDSGPPMEPGERAPVRGCVYTVRGWHAGDKEAIFVEEIINPPLRAGFEVSFFVWRFRPVKETSIEVFRFLISPIPEEVA